MKVAVIGATGAVGRYMVEELAGVPQVTEILPLASARSRGKTLMFRNSPVIVEEFSLDILKKNNIKYIVMSAGGTFSRQNSRQIADLGCIVIDNSSAWRMEQDVPLVVPEINAHVLKNFNQGIISNPNCTTIQMVVTLKPLSDAFGLDLVIASTYQSVSGSGQKGIVELDREMNELKLQNIPLADIKPSTYAKRIVSNLIPAIDTLDDTGHCFEEEKMLKETRKIMELPDVEVLASTVRVPVFCCHGETITVKLKKKVSRSEVLQALRSAKGVILKDQDTYEDLPTCIDAYRREEVFVSRVRLPLGEERSQWVSYWNVADNLKKGAATNAVQILKLFCS